MSYQPDRRAFLRDSGASLLLAAAGPLLCSSRVEALDPKWRNWSGSQHANPAALVYPSSEAELVRTVVSARGPIRCFGGGHSFSPLVPSSGTLISLERLGGLRSHDPAALTATLGAGTRILIAGDLLAGVGQSLYNQPDVNLQSVAGAVSTATHGTGLSLRCLSAYVVRLRLVLADGSAVEASALQDAELFQAARVAMGSCGVISELTFQNLPAYRLAEHTRVLDLDAAMKLIDERKSKDRHIEFFAFPFGGKALLKQLNPTSAATTPEPQADFDQNEVLELAAKIVRSAPWTKGMIQRLVGTFVDDAYRVADAHRVFPTPRAVPFNEMEYSVPAEHGLACLDEVMAVMRRHDLPVFFPIEFRYTAADDVWLSPFYQRASASISLHQYAPQSYREVFNALEPVFHKYQGRPHWGKLHTLTAAQLRERYPQWDAFAAVRKRVDPQGRFLNTYMHALLGVA